MTPIRDVTPDVGRRTLRAPTWLIAHVDGEGHGVAQARIAGTSETDVRAAFAHRYPDRTIIAVGIRGVS